MQPTHLAHKLVGKEGSLLLSRVSHTTASCYTASNTNSTESVAKVQAEIDLSLLTSHFLDWLNFTFGCVGCQS